MTPGSTPAATLRPARDAVFVVFALNGLLFASLASRIPDLRSGLELTNSGLGLLLLTIAAGSLIALPSSGWLVQRSSAATVVRLGVLLGASGLVVAAVGATGSVPLCAAGLFVYGTGIGVWDVAMNVEGAEVERRLERTIMPRFHAAWSFGSIAGAGLGVPVTALDVSMRVHLGVASVVAVVLVLRRVGTFLEPHRLEQPAQRPRSAWREPRTLLVGLMVLCFAILEGSANDWLSVALIDGYDVPGWTGVAGFAGFVCAMTAGRLAGPVLLDRFGRARVLWATSAAGAAGVLAVVAGGHPVVVSAGIVVWGLGASLGFPVGMSAAADDPARAAARVSVVSTIGYGAFLAGPPLLGAVGDRVGTLQSLLLVAVLMVPAAAAVSAVRRPVPAGV